MGYSHYQMMVEDYNLVLLMLMEIIIVLDYFVVMTMKNYLFFEMGEIQLS